MLAGTGGGGYEETKRMACKKNKISEELYDIVDRCSSRFVVDAAENASESSKGMKPRPKKKRWEFAGCSVQFS